MAGLSCDTPPPYSALNPPPRPPPLQHNFAIPPKGGGYSAIPCDTLKNVDAIGIAIPYSAIGGGRNVGPLSSLLIYESESERTSLGF